jgi:hypothetical protein
MAAGGRPTQILWLSKIKHSFYKKKHLQYVFFLEKCSSSTAPAPALRPSSSAVGLA